MSRCKAGIYRLSGELGIDIQREQNRSICHNTQKKGYRVPVAVWNISETDERNLDIYEGYPRFYYKQNVYVTLQDGSRIKAMVYIMFNGAKPGRPSERYVDTVYKGYRDFKLDYEFLIDSILTNNDELKKERG